MSSLFNCILTDMRVFRLEDKRGQGPYRGDIPKRVVKLTKIRVFPSTRYVDLVGMSTDDNHPAPLYDNMRGYRNHISYQYKFGFNSIEQYTAWFYDSGWRKEFARLGLVVTEYEIRDNHVALGDHQVAFVRRYAKKVAVHSPDFV